MDTKFVHNGRVNHRAIAVYLRVPTSRQDLRSQEPELETWLQTNAGDRPVAWYRDQHTGRSLDRPALGRLERDIIAGKVGTLVVWRSDRVGRRDLLSDSSSARRQRVA